MKKVIYKIMSVIILVCMMCPVTGCSNNDKKDYTVSELAAIKSKALQEKAEIENTNHKKLYKVLNS